MSHSSWLDELYSKSARRKAVKKIVSQIREDKKHFPIHYIVMSGISCASIGSIISYLTGIPVVVVRKDGENSHADDRVEYKEDYMPSYSETCNYIFIDDLIASGTTLRRVMDGMQSIRSDACLKKIYLYHASNRGQYNGIPIYNTDD